MLSTMAQMLPVNRVTTYLFTTKIEHDPMQLIVKLALLRFEPIGTKIGVHSNYLVFHPPIPVVIPLYRAAFGHEHDNLHMLTETIKKAVIQYKDNESEIKEIFAHAIEGIKKLKDTYENNTKDLADSWIALLSEQVAPEELKISETADKVKEIWSDTAALKQVQTWLNEATTAFPNKNNNQKDRTNFNNAIRNINALMNLQHTQFMQILSEASI